MHDVERKKARLHCALDMGDLVEMKHIVCKELCSLSDSSPISSFSWSPISLGYCLI